MKFKLGDIVIVVNPNSGYKEYTGSVGEIIGMGEDDPDLSIWYTIGIEALRYRPNFYEYELELESVYKSPLYKALT